MKKLLNAIEVTGNEILAKYDELEMEFNKGEDCDANKVDAIQYEISKLNIEQNENYEALRATGYFGEVSEIEVIKSALNNSEYAYNVDESGNITVIGDNHDISIVPTSNGYDCETFLTGYTISHFQTFEWANQKTVKTLRGLKGYLRKFGVEVNF